MRSDIYKTIFVLDGGALLDIRVFEVTPDDWQVLLHFLSTHYQILYEENGKSEPLPTFDRMMEKRKTAAVWFKIRLTEELIVSCHFFDADQIEMDILPEDVGSSFKAESVFALMTAMARILNKEVLLTPEFASADPEQLRQLALCSVDPKTGALKYHPQRR
ncbi:MAG TPA: hypothetical protein VK699_11840 [Terriglobales bacterium]|jgi:hypothetical protein|nr:hypothetical protein [Terriglobales bacterium]